MPGFCRNEINCYYCVREKSKTMLRIVNLPLILLLMLFYACDGHPQDAGFDESPASYQVSETLSNQTIRAFAEDQYGHIWIATELGLNRFTGSEYYQYFAGESENTLNNNSITSFLLDSEERFWITTISGVCRYEGRDAFVRVPVHTTMVASQQLLQTASGEIVLQTSAGEYLSWNEPEDAFNLIPTSAWPELEKQFDALQTGVEGAVVPEDGTGLSFSPTLLYRDSHDNIWAGTSGHGFRMFSGQPSLFNQNARLCEAFEGISVISLVADSEDNLWALASGDRLFFARKDGTVRRIPLSVTNLNVIAFDEKSNSLWVGTDAGLLRCDGEGRIIERIATDGHVRAIRFDARGRLFAGQNNGTVLVHEEGSPDTLLTLQSNRIIYDMSFLRDGTLVVTQFREGISVLRPGAESIETLDYREDVGDAFHLLSVFEDDSGDLLFPTRDFELLRYDVKTGRFSYEKGFSSPRLAAVAPASDGNLWISSANGLNLWKQDEGKIIPFHADAGIGGDQFNGRAVCSLSDGTVVFGGTHGLTFCHTQLAVSETKYPLLFEQLLVNGEPAPKQAWTGELYDGPQVRLKYNQNTLTISFASLDYAHAETSWYSYSLEGFDKVTVSSGNDHTVRYSNLPPGRYRLHVWQDSAFNTDPVEAILPITIRRAPWNSIVALVLYGLLLCAAVAGAYYYSRRMLRMRMSVEQSEREKEHERYINRMNMNFFANMAHEFRTPLTMIAGPVAQLQESDGVDAVGKRTLGVVRLSVDRMMKLVNHLLDFNKLDGDTLELKNVADFDIAEQLRKSVELFRINAARFGVRMETDGLDSSCRITVDPDQFESIIENLLSNAFKYTDRKSGDGMVRVRLMPGEREVRIAVENNGEPIPEEALSKLFDRYYQIREHTENQRVPGTGIGLYYAKKLALKMGGDLKAENGAGVVRFVLCLPSETVVSEKVELPEPLSPVEEESGIEEEDRRRSVLIVDDDADLANYLSMILSPYYRTMCAYDADRALEIASSKDMPHLILSDIVMPGQDGISLCKSLKSNLVTCHIPVILVTAKVGVDNEVEGLDSGADAYVTKPFDPEYILALIKSILRNRDLLKGELTSSTDILQVDTSLLGAQDREFIKQLYELMESEIDNPDFDIQDVAERMHVSRSKLFYKVRNLTGMSPLPLFRTYRLNVAANLLKTGKYNVSEVADKVGFISLSYFSKAFKQQFGILPKDAVGK